MGSTESIASPALISDGRAWIALDHVSYAVDGRTILCDLHLTAAVDRLGVIGRNGSGKSTLARLLAGLVRPSSGICRVNGVHVVEDREAALAEVGILFQNPDHQIIFPTVFEEVMFGLRQQGRSKAEAAAAARRTLSVFGKSHWEQAPVHTLSQGQKHLLCLMAVVAMAPRILILDEPFAGLDIPTKAQLASYLALYDGAIVHITHDPADLAGYGEVVWLDAGRICATGPCGKVLPAYLDKMKRLGDADDISDLAR